MRTRLATGVPLSEGPRPVPVWLLAQPLTPGDVLPVTSLSVGVSGVGVRHVSARPAPGRMSAERGIAAGAVSAQVGAWTDVGGAAASPQALSQLRPAAGHDRVAADAAGRRWYTPS